MSRLAAEVGLKQSSLYYYFPNREAVVAALVARRTSSRSSWSAASSPAAGRPPAQLLPLRARRRRGVVRTAVRHQRDPPGGDRATASVRRLLERAPPAGAPPGGRGPRRRRAPASCGASIARLTALTIMANDEGVQNWYRLGADAPPVGDRRGAGRPWWSAACWRRAVRSATSRPRFRHSIETVTSPFSAAKRGRNSRFLR